MKTNPGTLIALITGGSRGIGRAVCQRLAADGYFVIVNFKSNQSAAMGTLDTIQQNGGDGEIVQFDVSDRESTRKELEALLEKHGAIDVLVNNAGITNDQILVMMSAEK